MLLTSGPAFGYDGSHLALWEEAHLLHLVVRPVESEGRVLTNSGSSRPSSGRTQCERHDNPSCLAVRWVENLTVKMRFSSEYDLRGVVSEELGPSGCVSLKCTEENRGQLCKASRPAQRSQRVSRDSGCDSGLAPAWKG